MLATRNNIRKSLQLHQRFSTSASSNKSKKSSLQKQQILSKTLYKQILKWTARTGNVPFDPIPPLTLIPPRVDPIALETLANVLSKGNSDDEKGKETTVTSSSSSSNLSHLAKYLPSNSIIEANRLIIPISNAADVKRVTKLAYALNNHTLESKEDLEQIKERVSLGFDVLKSLNQLGAVLERRKEARVEHEDREGVTFHVGQVVQHKTERWRAIVSGWSKLKDKEVEKSTKTSLTNKEYDVDVNANESGEEGEETGLLTSAQEVQYVVHLDEGDAAQSRVRILGSMKVKQNELEAVTDDDLKKIRNSLLKHYFHSFDSRKGEFVPGEIMNFEYPMDSSPSSNNANDILEESKYTIAKHENSKVVLLGVREMASKLHRIIMDTTSCAEARNFAILSGVEKQLRAIITGEFEENIADQITPQTTSSHKLAIKHLHALLNVSLEVHTTLWQRKTAEENKDRIHFPLGSIVKHKKYGFRGVVVTWDPYPKADVSRWDGLQDIEGDVNKMPFYHVVPDLGDTVKAFGQERPFRYVCQENLEVCPESEQDIEVNLDEEWSSSSGEADFKPSDSLKFRHAETIGDDDNVIIACLNELQVKFNELFIDLRNGPHDNSDYNADSDGGKCNLHVKDLLALLHNSECLEDAFVADEGIKEVWKAHSNQAIRWSLDDGIAQLLKGNKGTALDIYNRIINAEDSEYMEAWNKKATCHYMLGEMPSSIEAARRAIEINAQHSQAYAGLGLVYNDTNQHKKAVESFRKCLSLNPWSPVSSRLTICLDTMKKLELEEDKE